MPTLDGALSRCKSMRYVFARRMRSQTNGSFPATKSQAAENVQQRGGEDIRNVMFSAGRLYIGQGCIVDVLWK